MSRIFSFPSRLATLFTHAGFVQGHRIYETAEFGGRDRAVVKFGFWQIMLIASMMAGYAFVDPFSHPWGLLQEFLQIPSLVTHTQSSASRNESPFWILSFVE